MHIFYVNLIDEIFLTVIFLGDVEDGGDCGFKTPGDINRTSADAAHLIIWQVCTTSSSTSIVGCDSRVLGGGLGSRTVGGGGQPASNTSQTTAVSLTTAATG